MLIILVSLSVILLSCVIAHRFFPNSVWDLPFDKSKIARIWGYIMWFLILIVISTLIGPTIIKPRISNQIYSSEKTATQMYAFDGMGQVYVIDLTTSGKPRAGYFIKTKDNFAYRIESPKFFFDASTPRLITTIYDPKPGIKSYLWTLPLKHTKYEIHLSSRESIVSR